MLAFLSSSWDILLASQSLSRVLFRIPSVPTCGAARLDFLGSVFASPCPDCPSSFWISRFASGIPFHSLETDSEIEFFISFMDNFVHFGPHEEVEERSRSLGTSDFVDNEFDLSWLRLLGMHDSSTVIGHSVTVPAPGRLQNLGCTTAFVPS